MTLDSPLPTWIAALASSSPTPGGGGASAVAGAVAAALAEMVGQLTVGRARFRDVEPTVRDVLERLAERRADLLRLVEEDAQAFQEVSAAYALPKASDDERRARDAAVQRALLRAMEPPRAVASAALAVLRDTLDLAEIGNPSVASDAGCAAFLAEASVRSAGLNILANAVLLRDAEAAAVARREQEAHETEAARLTRAALERVRARMGA